MIDASVTVLLSGRAPTVPEGALPGAQTPFTAAEMPENNEFMPSATDNNCQGVNMLVRGNEFECVVSYVGHQPLLSKSGLHIR